MESFINRLATDLYARYGDGVSSLNVLFPSRRARLFFNDTLARIARKPLWSPRFVTIDELMEQIAELKSGDPVRLVTELFQIYRSHHDETFDSFYFWGEMLLADFDSIDKYRIDARMLFRNIADLKTLESDLSYLSEEQIEIISRFWRSFGQSGEFSTEQAHFIRIWQSLWPVYEAFRDRLDALGFAYTGMVHRRAADRIKAGQVAATTLPDPARMAVQGALFFKDDDADNDKKEMPRYVIAGFNALSECEKILFDHLQNTAQVDFYWDYDDYYVGNRHQEAGLFLRENLQRYPETAPDPAGRDAFAQPKEITVVSAPSDSLQCKYVYDFLAQVAAEDGHPPGKETAVVLTDENLLAPVLYSIPEAVTEINVTMGYPLRQTLAYSFAERLVELQNRKRQRNGRTAFYHSDVNGLLSHPYVAASDPARARALTDEVVRRQQIYVDRDRLGSEGLIGRIFTPADDWHALQEYLIAVMSAVLETGTPHPTSRNGDQTAPAASGNENRITSADRSEENTADETAFRLEYFTLIAEQLHKLRNSLDESGLEISMAVFASLLRRMLQSMTVPYEGEPLQGVQIMGILETRNLDFENVVILSVNDDTFPGNRAVSSSFIPYNLRFAYGLPTPAHHEGVYAYYFYRLLQRARRVHLVYCSRSDDKHTGEPSRYIYQLQYESPHRIVHRRMAIDVNLAPAEPITVAKTDDVACRLEVFLQPEGPTISPTAFFRYIECPLKFYYYSVARIRPADEVTEEVDLPLFGTILHRAMELLYREIAGAAEPQTRIKEMIGSAKVPSAVDRAIRDEYLKDERASAEDYGGNLSLIRDIVIRYIDTCILPFDAAQTRFEVRDLEFRVEAGFSFMRSEGEVSTVRFGGVSDRIDRLPDGTLRVVDYKTGSPNTEFRGLDSLFSGKGRERNAAVLQTFLYAMMLDRTEHVGVQPALYYVRNLNAEDYSPLLIDRETGQFVERYADYKADFEGLISAVLGELFDLRTPFVQCEDRTVCQWCDYREICRR